ncbi:probable tRNA pseudouridine synthase 1 isoform X2 [Penaeus japonicus]|uniref:probable tRNA pseudouridine synthase 1 isoform X2 n=1 Tax=Penaeus japonicus TaxID=27405 RepID=UPI001C70B984|nr:probable tRNA pseudouridine synthase 1 isoform X2 [Penaeus japonicus]XP_042858097.1 probable tRNA pseudouridine synthase 1 isoform X2 [Penaeus japonicus]
MNSRIIIRTLNGVFPIIKPHGITSAEALNKIKQKLCQAVGIGDGCKKLKCLLHGEKHYIVQCQLGTATDTYNETGKVVMEIAYDHVTEELLKDSLKEFRGRINQLPPLYSALKLNGRRYSDLAREGVEVTIEPRRVFCYEAHLTSFSPPHFGLCVSTGPGFYIRSLIHDLGQAVGSCAHVRELQRTKHGPFTLSDALPEDRWNAEQIIQSIAKFRNIVNRYYKEYKMASWKDKW